MLLVDRCKKCGKPVTTVINGRKVRMVVDATPVPGGRYAIASEQVNGYPVATAALGGVGRNKHKCGRRR